MSKRGKKPTRTPRNTGKPQVAKQQAKVAITEQYSGPLPDPRALSQYDQVVPGAAERIIQAFEDESRHRRQLEQRAVEATVDDAEADRNEARRGQNFALIVALSTIVAGALLMSFTDKDVGAGLLGASGPIAIAFIRGRREKGTKDK